jgi:hypothetical protein
VKIKVRSLTISFLVIALLFVVVGGYLNFHVEGQPVSESQFLMTQSAHSSIAQEAPNAKDDLDPCIDGFCHIGHCAHLLVPEAALKAFNLSFPAVFFSRVSWPEQVYTDGPFQPPRFI